MSTVGYGDVNPTNTKERLFAVVIMIFGVVVFSFISGSLSSIMLTWDEKTSIEGENFARLARLRDHYKLDFDVYITLRRHV